MGRELEGASGEEKGGRGEAFGPGIGPGGGRGKGAAMGEAKLADDVPGEGVDLEGAGAKKSSHIELDTA